MVGDCPCDLRDRAGLVDDEDDLACGAGLPDEFFQISLGVRDASRDAHRTGVVEDGRVMVGLADIQPDPGAGSFRGGWWLWHTAPPPFVFVNLSVSLVPGGRLLPQLPYERAMH